MQRIAPDFGRYIELPGVGPCPRPVDIDQSVTGFADLVSLRIYNFSGAAPIEGEAEDDEVLIVLLDGRATITISGDHAADFTLSPGGIRAVYLPPGHHYRLTPEGKADVAYSRAKPRTARTPEGFAGPELSVDDYADRLQLRLVRLTETPYAAATAAGAGVERLVFVTATTDTGEAARLEPWHTLGLGRGDTAELSGAGEALIVAAR